MRQTFVSFLIACVLFCLAACGGPESGGDQPAAQTLLPPIPPPASPPLMPDFSAVRAAVDGFEVENMAVLIGDGDGIIFKHEKGDFRTNNSIAIASASKLVTGLAVWSLVESGEVSLLSRPADLLEFWADTQGDPRSGVTLEQLLSFTSGFNDPPVGPSCAGDGRLPLEDCINALYTRGTQTQPASTFAYGPNHMQIAALMTREAVGTDLKDTMRDLLFEPFELSIQTGFDAARGDNPRYSGDLISTAEDYAKLLVGLLGGQLLTDREGFLADRTSDAAFPALSDSLAGEHGRWHYGFGFWLECQGAAFSDDCANQPTISSPGAFGFTPWIDFKREYWAIIAMEEAFTFRFNPFERSIALEQELQAIIEDQLN